MTIQNHILPASIAAVIHAALLWAWIETPYHPGPKFIEIPLPPLPKPDDPVVLPPADKNETPQPVQPLAGGPSRPEIEDQILTPKPADFPIPVVDRRANFTKDLPIVPPDLGSGETGITGTGVNQPQIFSPTQLDRIPRAKVQPPPAYPAAMHQAGITGSVTVEFDVDTTGRVVRAVVIRSSHREFAEPAVRAVLQWHFEPGRRNGRPVPFRMAVPIEFNLAAD